MTRILSVLLLLLAPTVSADSRSGLERLEITSRETVPGTEVFGLAGPYEMLRGTAHFVIDPGEARNAALADLDLAPQGADGLVRYRASFYVAQPVDPKRGSGALLVDVPNRGNGIGMLFNFADFPFRPPAEIGPLGDGFLLRHGFTVAGVGWQQDLPRREGGPPLLALEPVVAEGVTGLARSEQVFPDDTVELPLGHWGHRARPLADRDDPRNVLTVRDHDGDERRVIPRERWHFNEPGTAVVLEGGFEKGKLYEVVWVARDPLVTGLGFAAVRDFVAYLENDPESPVEVDRSLAFGASQTGRFLRHFLYLGLNGDAEGRRVLDGVMATVAGAGRGSFNHRFAQPSRASLAFAMYDYPSELFPFAGTSGRDPLSGREDGLYRRVTAAGQMPKVFLVNTGHEYWGRSASLVHTTADGKADQPLHPDERVYVFASHQHGPATFPPTRVWDLGFERVSTRHPLNPANYLWSERALLLALDAWVARGTEPPPSRTPRLDDATLVPASELALPEVPGLDPVRPYVARLLDFGPRFAAEGIVSNQPPKAGGRYGVLVPQVDADGNELGGLKMPEVAVPLATYLSFNQRAAEMGTPEEMALLVGGFVPFARTEAERRAAGDPRPSVAERYPSREAYLGRYAEAALELIRQRYLLAEDLPSMLEYAGVLWRHVVETPGDAP